MSRISAVIPSYNVGQYIGEAIESVLRQTRPADEIIVVDDGSSDDTAAVAERFAARHPVRVVRHGTNRGNAAARNRCIAEARGDLLAWLDADDFWEPEHLDVVAGLLDRNPDAGAAFGAVRLCGALRGSWEPPFPPDIVTDVFWEAFRRTIGPQMAAVIRREAAQAVGGYDERIRSANDYEFFMRLARRYPMICTHRITANYRWHAGQLSRNRYDQYRNTHLARLRLRDEARAAGDEKLAHEMEERMRWIWEEDLRLRWEKREVDGVRMFLKYYDLVPGASEATRRRYARRAWIPRRVLRAWDLGAFGVARKVAARLRSGRD